MQTEKFSIYIFTYKNESGVFQMYTCMLHAQLVLYSHRVQNMTANKVFPNTLYFKLPPNSKYTLLKPLKYGRLNSPTFLSEGIHSLSLVLNTLEDLWTKATEDYLEISKSEFKYHRVVVIDRTVLRELMNLLLIRMEFAAAFLHQVHMYLNKGENTLLCTRVWYGFSIKCTIF